MYFWDPCVSKAECSNLYFSPRRKYCMRSSCDPALLRLMRWQVVPWNILPRRRLRTYRLARGICLSMVWFDHTGTGRSRNTKHMMGNDDEMLVTMMRCWRGNQFIWIYITHVNWRGNMSSKVEMLVTKPIWSEYYKMLARKPIHLNLYDSCKLRRKCVLESWDVGDETNLIWILYERR